MAGRQSREGAMRKEGGKGSRVAERGVWLGPGERGGEGEVSP